MKSYPAALRTLLRAPVHAEHIFDVLVEIKHATPIRRVLSSSKQVTWPPTTGDVYYPASGAFSILSDSLDGNRPQVTLTLANIRDPEDDSVVLPWSTLLAGTNFNGTEVVLRFVATNSGDATAEIEAARWYISGVNSLTNEAVVFHVGSPHDALAAVVPRISLGSTKCGAAIYQQGFCTSLSDLTTCSRTLDDCRKRFGENEPLKFGPGFPLFSDARRRGVS